MVLPRPTAAPAPAAALIALVTVLGLLVADYGTQPRPDGQADRPSEVTATADPAEPSPTGPAATTDRPATPSAGDQPDADAAGDQQRAVASVGPDGEPVEHRIEVVATHPHDPAAYTQGLEVVGDLLLESTGLRGESTLRLVEPTSGEVLRSIALADELFGEGATVVGDEVWQLTWTSGIATLRGLDDLLPRRQVAYKGEGWGLCAEPDRLVMSDGSSTLTFRDPETFAVLGSVEVRDGDEPVARLNELECVDGLVWANIFQSTRLVGIEPTSGLVVATADVAELVPAGYEGDGTNVANGIALDPETGRFWLTGKRWPVIYEVELVPES